MTNEKDNIGAGESKKGEQLPPGKTVSKEDIAATPAPAKKEDVSGNQHPAQEAKPNGVCIAAAAEVKKGAAGDQQESDQERTEETNTHGDKPVLERAVPGTVKWFSAYKKYGFIKRTDTNIELFVHRSGIAKFNPKKLFRSLRENEQVEFDVVQGPKGLEAANVTGPNGTPVLGSEPEERRHVRTGKRSGGRRKETSETGGTKESVNKTGDATKSASKTGDATTGEKKKKRNRGRGRGPRPKKDDGKNHEQDITAAKDSVSETGTTKGGEPSGAEGVGNKKNRDRARGRRPKKDDDKKEQEQDSGATNNDASMKEATKPLEGPKPMPGTAD